MLNTVLLFICASLVAINLIVHLLYKSYQIRDDKSRTDLLFALLKIMNAMQEDLQRIEKERSIKKDE